MLRRLPLVAFGPRIFLGTKFQQPAELARIEIQQQLPDSASIARPSSSTRIFLPSAYSFSSVSGSSTPRSFFVSACTARRICCGGTLLSRSLISVRSASNSRNP